MRFPWLMHPPGGYGGQGVADTPGVVGKQRERRAAGGGWPAAGSPRRAARGPVATWHGRGVRAS